MSYIQDLESPRQDLERPRQDLESPRQDLESSRQDLESSRQDLESPRQDLESPFKIYLDNFAALFLYLLQFFEFLITNLQYQDNTMIKYQLYIRSFKGTVKEK